MTTLEPLDPTFADSIFEELAVMDVQLDEDPLIYGPKRLNGKVALTRKMSSRCERIFLGIAQNLARYKRGLRASELLLDAEKKNLLANDPLVRSGRAVSEREAFAAGKLVDEIEAVSLCKNAVEELDMVVMVIKAKRSDLRDIQGRLRDQMRLCQEELGLGGRWGSRPPPADLEPGRGVATGADVDSMDSVIQLAREASDEVATAAAEAAEAEEVLEVVEEATVEEATVEEATEEEATEEEATEEEATEEEAAEVPEPALIVVSKIPDDLDLPEVASAPTVPVKHPENIPAPSNIPLVDEDEDYDIPVEDPEAEDDKVLDPTAGDDEVVSFLAVKDPVLAEKSRREIEEEDELDIESILSNL